ADHAEIAQVVATFFATFVSGPGCLEGADRLRAVCLPGAVIVTAGLPPVVDSLESFLAPRLALLTEGRLQDFTEWPEDGRTDVHGDVAQWFGGYGKRGLLDGAPYAGRGAKSIQLVRTGEGWRISAVAWTDDPA
ncbi:MAG TPA: DUF4440 domain-containing protein, partial [Nocardioides sp.]|nr:DUF4440 domain-containing protein [Nocardioides sp.]